MKRLKVFGPRVVILYLKEKNEKKDFSGSKKSGGIALYVSRTKFEGKGEKGHNRGGRLGKKSVSSITLAQPPAVKEGKSTRKSIIS